jgi:hypothetical protein
MKAKIYNDIIFNSTIISEAKKLPNYGNLIKFKNFIFLTVHDDFIHKLNPMLAQYGIVPKPDYSYEEGTVGAHITVIYPEENFILPNEELNKKYLFDVKSLSLSRLDNKSYFTINIESEELNKLRQKYLLPTKPKFLNNIIDMHITIGVCKNRIL